MPNINESAIYISLLTDMLSQTLKEENGDQFPVRYIYLKLKILYHLILQASLFQFRSHYLVSHWNMPSWILINHHVFRVLESWTYSFLYSLFFRYCHQFEIMVFFQPRLLVPEIKLLISFLNLIKKRSQNSFTTYSLFANFNMHCL